MMTAIISGEALFRNIPAQGKIPSVPIDGIPDDRFFQIWAGERRSLLAGFTNH
jgi:hypothetical protein